MHNLQYRFDFVGLAEDVELSLAMLRRLLPKYFFRSGVVAGASITFLQHAKGAHCGGRKGADASTPSSSLSLSVSL